VEAVGIDLGIEGKVAVVCAASRGLGRAVAAVVAFLCSTRAAYVTGSAVGVEGGATRGLP